MGKVFPCVLCPFLLIPNGEIQRRAVPQPISLYGPSLLAWAVGYMSEAYALLDLLNSCGDAHSQLILDCQK